MTVKRKIAAHPSIGKRNPGSDLPANWTILGALSGLAEHDFEWARRRGLIKPDMSRGAARAIKKARESKDPTDLITNKDRLPRPSEAREIALSAAI